MATWQADYTLEAPATGFPPDLAKKLASVAPPGRSWSPALTLFGVEEGSRIDLWSEPGDVPEVSFRIDLRAPDLTFARAIFDLAVSWGARIIDENEREVSPEWPAMVESLRQSPAFRFVSDPRAFLDRVREGGES